MSERMPKSEPSAGEQKVNEYFERIRAGASKEEVLRDLPPIFRTAVEQKLGASAEHNPNSTLEEGSDNFTAFTTKNGETDEGSWWYEYRNKEAKRMKESGQFEWGKERIYFDIPLAEMGRMRELAMKVAGEEHVAIAFKHLDEEKTIPAGKDGTETRFVANFATAEDALKFYAALKKNPEYSLLKPDRALSYGGYRADAIAEYANGYRETRDALARIMQGNINGKTGEYEWKTEGGDTKHISVAEYARFKEQFDSLNEKIEKTKEQWELALKQHG